MKDLMVLHGSNGTFIDHSIDARDYLRDDFTINYVAATDKIYIGLYKKFNSMYVEISTPSISAITIKTNSNILTTSDDTKSFSRSGFIQWDKPTNWAVETINGISAYWLELTSDLDIAPVFSGINIVFSDDNDLMQESRGISRDLAKGDTSFIAYHVSARNEIIQTLRNGGNTKFVDNLIKNITKWDILDIGEIRQASKYLTLSKIYFDISVNNEDKSYLKFRDYKSMFSRAFKLWIMSIDQNDDGDNVQQDDLILNNAEIVRV